MPEKLWHNLNVEEVTKILETNLKDGLSEKEAKSRQEKFGLNKLPEEKTGQLLKIFLDQLKNPLIYILLVAGIITLALESYSDTIIIFSVVILNTLIGFFQEFKTLKILQTLKKIVKVGARVVRNGHEKELDQEELVPGDIFILRPGDKVPADGRLFEVHNLKINESALTGEWIAAEKKTEILPADIPLADRDNMVYMGTIVEDGRAKAVVTDTGEKTEIGKIAFLVKEIKEEKTPYQKKVSDFGKLLSLIILFLSFLIFIFGIVFGQETREMLITAIATAVAAIPEGLPAAVTVTFAFGMQTILKRKGLVRQMIAAETLGSTSIICTDKTGTLTEAKMEVAGIYTGRKELLSDERRYSQTIDKNDQGSHLTALKIATLCNEAFIENPEEILEKWIVRGRPTEKALLIAGFQAGLDKRELEKKEPKIGELPFDPVYKYSATLHKLNEEENVLYVLGAPEIILEKSNFFDIDGQSEVFSQEKVKRMKEKVEELAKKGERILAAAYRKIPSKEKFQKLDDLCKNLTFVGLIALHDPLRKETREAIRTCLQAGMKPIIVTGDHKLTAKAVAEKIGLSASLENILEGEDLDRMSNEEFKEKLPKIEIYTRVEPRHKIKIVEFWQEKGEVVAMTGDGVNDAPALRKANIGIALGSGTEVAKAASDLILLDDNFTVIVSAVREGRRIIDNVRKIITYLLTGGFTEVMLIGLTVIFRLPLPVLAGQILWKNLIESAPPAMALTFEPPEKDIMLRKPESPNLPLLTKQMKTLIFGVGILTNFLLFGIFLWFLNHPHYGLAKIDQIRTVMFAGLAVDSFFFIFSFRNLKRNIWQYNPFSNFYVNLAALIGFSLLLVAIYLPFFQTLLRTVPFGFFEWLILIGFALVNIILIEATKWYYIRKYNRAKE